MSSIQAIIHTPKGDIHISLFQDKTPITVASFVNLAQSGFYTSNQFHRVVSNFVIQGGCPTGNGTGNPGYRFGDEFDATLRHNQAGILSMANSGPETNGSQFFITLGPTPHLDDLHSVFGLATDLTVVNQITQDDVITSIEIHDDTSPLLEQQKDHINQWNQAINQAFPHLQTAGTE